MLYWRIVKLPVSFHVNKSYFFEILTFLAVKMSLTVVLRKLALFFVVISF